MSFDGNIALQSPEVLLRAKEEVRGKLEQDPLRTLISTLTPATREEVTAKQMGVSGVGQAKVTGLKTEGYGYTKFINVGYFRLLTKNKGSRFLVTPCFYYWRERLGLEPATFGVTGRRSNQLNYAPKLISDSRIADFRLQTGLPRL